VNHGSTTGSRIRNSVFYCVYNHDLWRGTSFDEEVISDLQMLSPLHIVVGDIFMDKRHLKVLIQSLEDLLAELKVEVYADKDAYLDGEGYYQDSYDDDGYPD
jgi:hypothetical protein